MIKTIYSEQMYHTGSLLIHGSAFNLAIKLLNLVGSDINQRYLL